MSFTRAIGSELLKLVTTRMWWILLLVLVGYVGITAGGLALLFGWISEHPEARTGSGNTPIPPGTNLSGLIYAFATTVGFVFPVLLGALSTTGEFRHETLTPTFLATPRRGVVLTAKIVVLVVFGALFGVAAFAASVGAGAGGFAVYGIENDLGSGDTWWLIARGILAMALWAAVGVGLGALVKSQVAAIVIVLAFTQFVEPLVRLAAGFVDATAQIARFLPGAASDALVGASFFNVAGAGASAADPLDWWQGGLVLLGYAVVFTVAGYFTSWRKDVS